MKRFMRKNRGAVSVFLILILLPTLVFNCFLIDGSKLIAAKSAASDAGDLAMNGALADYNTMIKDVYGLFAMSESGDELRDNVERYFRETLNAANIDDSGITDGYTMLDMAASNVTAQPLAGSQLANTEVLKAQILEYTKYRGLVSIGTGVLDKFTALSSLKKQQKAVDRKMEYDEKLGDIQDELQAAYDKINEYLDRNVKGSEISALNREVEGMYLLISHYNMIYQELEVQDYKEVGPTDTMVRNYTEQIKNLSEEEWKEFLDLVKEKYYDASTSSNYQMTKNKMYLSAEKIKSINNADQFFSELNNIKQQWKKISDIKDPVTDQEMSVEQIYARTQACYDLLSKNSKKAYKSMHTTLNSHASTYDVITCRENAETVLKKEMEILAFSCQQMLSEGIDILRDAGEVLELASTKIRKAIEKMDELSEAKTAWVNAANDLPEGDSKSSMLAEVNSRAEKLNETEAKKLKQLLGEMREQFQTCIDTIKSIKYNGQALYVWREGCTEEYIALGKEIYSQANQNRAKGEILFMQKYSGNDPVCDKAENSNITNNKFYQYLKNICAESEKAEKEEKKDAKNKKKSFLESGKLETNIDDLDGVGYTSKTGGTNDQTGSSDNLQENSTKNDKKFSSTARSSSESFVSTFDKLVNILTEGRNDILLEEYATEMFSCYTTDRKKNGEMSLSGNSFANGTIKTLTGTKEGLKSANYRSEVEYILYGKKTPAQNVKAARTSIFGVRFVLNLIYAFTGDAEIKSETLALATAIAGWTGFGVPIVQNVLIVAMAMAESVYDVNELMKGESVVIYKSTDTWKFKGSGLLEIGGEVVTDTVKKTVDTATGKVNDLLSNAEKMTTEKIDELSGNVTGMVKEKAVSLADSAVNAVLTPMQSACLTVIPEVSMTDEQIETAVNSAFQSVESSIHSAAGGNELTEFAGQQCLNYIKGKKGEIVSKLKTARGEEDSTHKAISKYFVGLRSNLVGSAEQPGTLTSKIINSNLMKSFESKMNSLSGKLKEEVTKAKDAASDAVNNAAEQIKAEMSETIAAWTVELESDVGQSLTGKNSIENKSVSNGVSLTMNYKEYLKVFTVLALFTNQDSVVERMGAVIEINATHSDNPEAQTFMLSSAYTMISIDAKVGLRTTFMRNVYDYIGKDSPSYLDDDGRYTFTYRSAIGY